MGMAELVKDPRFIGGLNRWRHREEIDKVIASRTIAYERKELMDLLQKNGLPLPLFCQYRT